MSTTQPATQAHPAPFRIRIVQDVPAAAQQQANILRREAAGRNLSVEVAAIELRDPADRILAQLTTPDTPIDWLVLDLLISPIDDHSPMTSAGLNLLRRIAKAGMFHGYKPRQPATRPGMRCIAIYSASLDNYGGHGPEIREELRAIGVDSRHCYTPGRMKDVAIGICDELQRVGPDGWR